MAEPTEEIKPSEDAEIPRTIIHIELEAGSALLTDYRLENATPIQLFGIAKLIEGAAYDILQAGAKQPSPIEIARATPGMLRDRLGKQS